MGSQNRRKQTWCELCWPVCSKGKKLCHYPLKNVCIVCVWNYYVCIVCVCGTILCGSCENSCFIIIFIYHCNYYLLWLVLCEMST